MKTNEPQPNPKNAFRLDPELWFWTTVGGGTFHRPEGVESSRVDSESALEVNTSGLGTGYGGKLQSSRRNNPAVRQRFAS